MNIKKYNNYYIFRSFYLDEYFLWIIFLLNIFHLNFSFLQYNPVLFYSYSINKFLWPSDFFGFSHLLFVHLSISMYSFHYYLLLLIFNFIFENSFSSSLWSSFIVCILAFYNLFFSFYNIIFSFVIMFSFLNNISH